MTNKTDKNVEKVDSEKLDTQSKENNAKANPPVSDNQKAKTDTGDTAQSAATADTKMPPTTRNFPEQPTSSPSGSNNTVKGGAKNYQNKVASPLPSIITTAVIVALLSGGAMWWVTQQQAQHSAEFEQSLQASIRQSNAAQQQAEQALQQMRQQAQHIQRLQAELSSIDERSSDLAQAFQNLTDAGGQVALLNDIDHMLTLAQQQLSVSGNLSNAIISLETAQARLARANKPSLASLQQTINGDLQQLRSVRLPDIPELSLQLEALGTQLSKSPLIVPELALTATSEHTPVANTDAPAQTGPVYTDQMSWWDRSLSYSGYWLGRGWQATKDELNELVSIQRVDDATALLLSPEQAGQLRANIRSSISSARLALMTHQQAVWKTELDSIAALIQRRFDTSDANTQAALRQAQALADTSVEVQLPSLENSLVAIEILLQGEESKVEQSTPAEAVRQSSELHSESEVKQTEQPPVPSTTPHTEQQLNSSEQAEDALVDDADASAIDAPTHSTPLTPEQLSDEQGKDNTLQSTSLPQQVTARQTLEHVSAAVALRA